MVFNIKKFILFVLCIIKYLFSGKANKKIKISPKKVLIIQTAKLGDMVCTTPMFRAVKEKYLDCKVYVLGNKINKELLENNNDVDEYIVFGDYLKMIKKIKKERFDFGCVTGPDFIGLSLLYLSNIPLISAPIIKNGFSPYETKMYKIIRNFVIKKEHRMGHYAPREYLRLLEPINIFTDDTKKYLKFSEKAEQKILNLLKNNDFDLGKDLIVGISPSAGNKIKQWPPKRFAEVAEYIYKKYSGKIIIIGGPNDQAEVGEMIKNMGNKIIFLNAQGALNIDELKAMISKLKIFISVDTGPIYIAEAFGVPTIDIVGPMDEREQPPIGERHKIVKSKNRLKPELHIMNARVYGKEEALRQINEISVNMVTTEFDDLITF